VLFAGLRPTDVDAASEVDVEVLGTVVTVGGFDGVVTDGTVTVGGFDGVVTGGMVTVGGREMTGVPAELGNVTPLDAPTGTEPARVGIIGKMLYTHPKFKIILTRAKGFMVKPQY
jgi:hypothetical protein